MSALQTEFIGSNYQVLEIYLYKEESDEDFYVDAIHIGKKATTNDEQGTHSSIFILALGAVTSLFNV